MAFLRVNWSTFLECQAATAVVSNYGSNFRVAQDWPNECIGSSGKLNQPVIAVPLCQCERHLCVTGNSNFHWHEKTTQKILISSP